MKIFNYNIDFKSFFKRGIKSKKDDFGVSLITGAMGTGKTYLSIYLANRFPNNIKIKTNIKTLHIPGKKIYYFEYIDDIVQDIEENVLYIIDEISRKYTKECKQDKGFYSWLQQSRKRHRYVLLITQEYLQVPIWLRGVSRFVYTTNKLPLFPSFFITSQGYAVLDDDTKEWNVSPIQFYIYKRNSYIANFYDTYEPVNTL